MRQRDHAQQQELASFAFPISKLRRVPATVRRALKARRINTCGQLLSAAGQFEERATLARVAQIEPEILAAIVCRADLARINGLGLVFGQMLEELGVLDVATLAAQDPDGLHEHLRHHNQMEGLARRAPTSAEVLQWVSQARTIPVAVHHGRPDSGTANPPAAARSQP